MESLNVKNINDEKIFNVIDPNGQGDVTNRIRPISISISQKVETINNEQVSKVSISVYWNDTWKSILDLSFDDSLRNEYGKLVTDLTAIQKDIDMKQYKDAETKTADFLKYVSNLSSKYTAIPETTNVAANTNDFVAITANKNSFSVKISDKLLNFMLSKFAKVANMDYTKASECFNVKGNNIDIYFHSPELFAKQAYMTVVKDNNVIGSYKATYDQFSKLASKLTLTPQKLGFYKDKRVGYIKNAEVVMQNIFFDSVDEAKEWQEMVDEKKKTEIVEEKSENGTETTEVKETETKTVSDEGASTSPVKEEGGLVRPSEDFASDELPEGQPRQQEQMGQGMAASRRVKNVKKVAGKRLWVEVIYGKGKDDYWVTDMNPNVTDEEVRKYFTGHSFNIDHGFDEKGQPIEKFVRPYEVIIHREDDKQASKKVKLNKRALNKKAGTSNFKTYDKYPLIAIGDDDVYSIKAFVNNYNEENEDKITEEEVLKSSALMEMYNDYLTIYYQDYINEMKSAIDRKDTPYHDIGIKGGYYEGLQLTVNEKDEDFYNDYDNDHWDEYSKYWDNGEELTEEYKKARDAAWNKECEKVAKIMEELGKENGWGQYTVAYRMSNGETGYTKVNANKVVKLKRKANLKKKAIMIGETNPYDIELNELAKQYSQEAKELPEGSKEMYELNKKYTQLREQLKNKYKVASTKKKAIEGDVQEADMVTPKTETKVYLESEDKAEETVEENEVLAIGDIVAIDVDTFENEKEFIQYGDYAGIPLVLMETDKENIDNVIVETVDYPYERISVARIKIVPIGAIADEQVIVEDEDGDEMITNFVELPIVAKSCKIKSIKKAALLIKKADINSQEELAIVIDKVLSDYDWYDYADQLEIGEKSHYENILADLKKDEKATIEALFSRIEEDGEDFKSTELEQVKEYYNKKYANGDK